MGKIYVGKQNLGVIHAHRIFCLGLLQHLCCLYALCAHGAVAGVSVELDGELLTFEQPPVIIEERTLVPLRAIFEALGASVEWDGATKTAVAVKGDISISVTINSNIAMAELKSDWLDVGSWKSIYDVSEKDENGNVIKKYYLHVVSCTVR